jgi:hypothetical protein
MRVFAISAGFENVTATQAPRPPHTKPSSVLRGRVGAETDDIMRLEGPEVTRSRRESPGWR